MRCYGVKGFFTLHTLILHHLDICVVILGNAFPHYTYKSFSSSLFTFAESNLPPMADKLNDKQISELKEYFSFLDKDGDGSINNKELETLIRSAGLNPTDFDLMVSMNRFDTDENSTIDFPEFLNQIAQKRTYKELKIAFHICDKDQNGFVSASELRYFLKNLGQKLTDEELSENVHEADVDGDGQINYEEFVKVMMIK